MIHMKNPSPNSGHLQNKDSDFFPFCLQFHTVLDQFTQDICSLVCIVSLIHVYLRTLATLPPRTSITFCLREHLT